MTTMTTSSSVSSSSQSSTPGTEKKAAVTTKNPVATAASDYDDDDKITNMETNKTYNEKNSNNSSSNNQLPIAAIAQLRSTNDKFRNLLDVAECCGMAYRQNATMIFLPECFAFLGTSADETLNHAEPMQYVERFRSNNNDHSHKIATTYDRSYHEEDETTTHPAKKKISTTGHDIINSEYVNQALLQAFQRGVDNNSSDDSVDNVQRKDIIQQHQDDDNQQISSSNVDDDGNSDNMTNSNNIEIVTSVTAALSTLAQHSGLWISAGGLHVKGETDDDDDTTITNTTYVVPTPHPISGRQRIYNTHCILDSAGTVRAVYNKRHLFDVSIPSQGVELRESNTTCPGRVPSVVCDTPLGKIGLSICYDVRFPEHYTDLVERHGATILLVPSAFTVPTGAAHWHILLQSRAIENQCYVFAAAQYGVHNPKRKSFGHALAVDPWGTIVADAGGYPRSNDSSSKSRSSNSVDKNNNNGRQQQQQNIGDDGDESIHVPSIVLCDVDQELVQTTRQKMPLQHHRKAAAAAADASMTSSS